MGAFTSQAAFPPKPRQRLTTASFGWPQFCRAALIMTMFGYTFLIISAVNRHVIIIIIIIIMALHPFVGPWPLFSFLILYTVGRAP
jgi:hypothetical protein